MTSDAAPEPRDIAVVAFAQSDTLRSTAEVSEVEMLMPVLHDVIAQTGLKTADIGFTCSGSCDYLAGRAFSFTLALDGVGAWPPISESHVEMDGAWALYEAWTKLLSGDADTALVYAYGKSSPGSLRDVLTRQLDPYYVAPLWPDSVALAALQAQALIDAGDTDEPELAAIGARSRATDNPRAQLKGPVPQGDYLVRPLRTGDCPPIGDGAAAVVLAAGERARSCASAPPGSAGSTTASRRTPSASATSPTLPPPVWRPSGPGPSNGPWTPPSCTRRSPRRKSSCARRCGSVTTSASIRPAAPSPPTR